MKRPKSVFEEVKLKKQTILCKKQFKATRFFSELR